MPAISSASPEKIEIPTDVPTEWSVGDVILDSYEIKKVFTSGGMAFVYQVYHPGWDLDLAVKSPKLPLTDAEGALDNFIREAETWVNLGLYPHIVSCYFIRLLGDIPRIFMEYVEGGSLMDAISEGRLYTGSQSQIMARLIDIAIQAAWGLEYAHVKGLIHQDVKPANILLDANGLAKVTDFGMAQANALVSPPADYSPVIWAAPEGKSMLVNAVGMTPPYCSPEQASGGQLSRRTDIYSLAVSILEMFIGGKTWTYGPFVLEAFDEYLNTGPANPAIPLMPAVLASLLRRCFAFDPRQRPASMRSLAQNLEKIYTCELGWRYPRSNPRMETVLADTFNNRAVSMLDLGKREDALRLFNAALGSESIHSTARYNHDLLLWRSADLTDIDVVAALSKNMREHPGSPEPARLLALIHLERGDSAEASRILELAIERFSPSPYLQRLQEHAETLRDSSGRCLKTFFNIGSGVNSLAFSPFGDWFLTGGNDRCVRLWDASSGECLRSFPGHTHPVKSVALSPDGRLALSAGWDQTVRLWELASGACLEVLTGHEGVVHDVTFTSDGKRALSASSDHTLRQWDLLTGETLQTFLGHHDSVYTVALLNGGETAISASFDNTLRLWDLQTAACLSCIELPGSCTSNLAVTGSGDGVIVADANHTLWLLDLNTGQPLHSFSGHTATVRAVQVTPNNRWVLSGSSDGTLRLWDLASGRCLRTYLGHSSPVNALSISHRKMLAISCDGEGAIKVWLLGVGPRAPFLPVLPRSSSEVVQLSDQVEAHLRLARQRYLQGDYPAAIEAISAARAVPGYLQNPRLLKSSRQVGKKGVRAAFRSAWLSHTLAPHSPGVNALALSFDARTLLSGDEDGGLSLWRLPEGERILRYHAHQGKVKSVALDTRRNLALSAGSDGLSLLWSLNSDQPILPLSGHSSEINSLALSPDGRLALSGSNDNTLRLWDLNTGGCLRVFQGHTHYVRSVAFTPDGRRALSASWDGSLRLWDLISGECFQVFEGHKQPVETMVISPDGTLALTAGQDRSLRLWDLEAGDALNEVEDLPAQVNALAFTSCGHFAFSSDLHGEIKLWDIKSTHCLHTIKPGFPLAALVVSRQGDLLVTAGPAPLIKIWQLDWDYRFPPLSLMDKGLQARLAAFIYQHKPFKSTGLERVERPTWNKSDFEELLSELSYAGYGGLAPRQVHAALKKLTRCLS